MSLKKILKTPISKEEKLSKKSLYTSERIHSRISMLAEIYGCTKSEILTNIIDDFFRNNEEEIKEGIIIRRNMIDNMF